MGASRTPVTGAAGFIGSDIAAGLADAGHDVVGCGNFNDYYDPALKTARVSHFLATRKVSCRRVELAVPAAVYGLVDTASPEIVVHLAAQAGVRHSIKFPQIYIQSNVVAFGHVLEACVRSASSISFMSATAASTAQAKTARSRKSSARVAWCRSTLPPSRRTNLWRTAVATFTNCGPPGCASSLSTGLGVVPK